MLFLISYFSFYFISWDMLSSSCNNSIKSRSSQQGWNHYTKEAVVEFFETIYNYSFDIYTSARKFSCIVGKFGYDSFLFLWANFMDLQTRSNSLCILLDSKYWLQCRHNNLEGSYIYIYMYISSDSLILWY